MITQFLPLFSLRVTHAYYGGVSDDLEILIPDETARLLRRCRLLAKTLDGVLHVVFEAEEGGTPRVGAASQTLRFGLRLQNPAFSVFTSPPPPVAPDVLVLRNRGSAGALDAAETRTLVGSKFSHTLGSTARPLTVTARDGDGAPLAVETVTAANDRPDVSFDSAGAPPGAFSVEETGGSASAATRFYYLHPELKGAGVLALVEIGLADAFRATPPAFELAFDARSDTLKYYIVVSGYRDADFQGLAVADAGDPDDPRAPIAFTRVEASDFGPNDLPPKLLALDGANVVMFKSNVSVSRRQRGRKKIGLSSSGDVLIESLPQPGADKQDANMILHISK